MSFPIYVSRDSVDAYLVYRRIFPDIGCGTRWGFINDVLKTMLKKSILDNQIDK